MIGIDKLIDYVLFKSHSECFNHMVTSPLPVKGCKLETFAWRLWPLTKERSLLCHREVLTLGPCSAFVVQHA